MKTLALNMIVGPGDAGLLDRCAKAFDFNRLFDEIVIAVTTEEPAVMEVAQRVASTVVSHKWANTKYPYGNFAAARNAALRVTKSDFVMWLDADDLPSDGFCDLFPTLRQVMEHDYDVFNMRYKITETEHTVRERIFRRRADLFWVMPVHEQLPINSYKHSIATISNVHIVHAPDKIAAVSVSRNVNILRREYENNPSPHVSFYYAKELYNLEESREEAVQILLSLVKLKRGTTDMIAQVCLTLANYYLSAGRMRDAETYTRIGMGYNEHYPNFYRILGDIYTGKGDEKQALAMYKKAIDCRFNGGGLCNKAEQTYSAQKIALAYWKCAPELALHYAKLSEDAELYGSILKGLSDTWQQHAL